MGCAASTTESDPEVVEVVSPPKGSPISDVPMFVSDVSGTPPNENSFPTYPPPVGSPPPGDEASLTQGPPPCWRRPTEFRRVSSEEGDSPKAEKVLESSVASLPFGSEQLLTPRAFGSGNPPLIRGDSFVAGGLLAGPVPRGRSYSIARTGSHNAHETHTASLLVTAPQARVRRKSVAFVVSKSPSLLSPESTIESRRLSLSAVRSSQSLSFCQTARFVKEEEMGRSPLSVTHIGREDNATTTGEYYSYKQVPLLGIPFDQQCEDVSEDYVPDWFVDLQKTVKIGHRSVQPVQTILRIAPENGRPAMAGIIGDFYVNDSVENVRCDAARIRPFLRDVILGLRQLHSLGLPHRHLTARNVFKKDTVAGGGYAIGDTGLGRLFASKSANELLSMGYSSVGLIPPEIAAHPLTPAKEVVGVSDEAHDMWSVGCLCWRLYFGHAPHPELPKNASEVQRSEWLASVASERVDCSGITGAEDLQSVVEWMLEPHPADRPSFIGILKHPFLVQLSTVNLQSSISTSHSHQSDPPHISPIFATGPRSLASLPQPTLSSYHFSAHLIESTPTITNLTDVYLPPSNTVHDRRGSKQEGSFHVHDEIKCSNCSKPVQTLGYFCTDCGRGPGMFTVCMGCFYQASYVHPSGHDIQPYVVDVVAVNDEPLFKSFSSQQAMGSGVKPFRSVLIPASDLTERERTILSMTGQLPSTLSIDRRRGRVQRTASGFGPCSSSSAATSVRVAESPQRSPALTNLSATALRGVTSQAAFGSTVAPDFQEESGGLGSGFVTPTICHLRQGLLTEAAAVEDATPASVLDECAIEGYSDCMLCNFDLVDIPRLLLEPPMLNVTVLDLSNNALTSVDPDVQFLVNLRRLILGNNKLTSIPPELGNLSDLEVLDLNHNQVTELPQELMFCDQLVELALDYNDFSEIPSVVFDLPCISTIFLAANPRLDKWPAQDLLATLPTCTIGVDNQPELFAAWKELNSHIKADLTVSWNKIYPDMIMPNLYCGSLRSAQSPAVYERLNIQYLLTMGRGLEPVVTSSMSHKTVIVDDIEGATISSSFDEATAFIAEAMEKGVGCLVHCFAGMSRSATAVVVYLMLKRNMRLDEAYLLVKKGRPAIHPNDGFFKQMMELDAKVYPDGRPLDIVSLERDKIP